MLSARLTQVSKKGEAVSVLVAVGLYGHLIVGQLGEAQCRWTLLLSRTLRRAFAFYSHFFEVEFNAQLSCSQLAQQVVSLAVVVTILLSVYVFYYQFS